MPWLKPLTRVRAHWIEQRPQQSFHVTYRRRQVGMVKGWQQVIAMRSAMLRKDDKESS